MKIFSPQIIGTLNVDGNTTITGSAIISGSLGVIGGTTITTNTSTALQVNGKPGTTNLLRLSQFTDNTPTFVVSATDATNATMTMGQAAGFGAIVFGGSGNNSIQSGVNLAITAPTLNVSGSLIVTGSVSTTGALIMGLNSTNTNHINIANKGYTNTIDLFYDGIAIGRGNVLNFQGNGFGNYAIGESNTLGSGNFTSYNTLIGQGNTISGNGSSRIIAGGANNIQTGGVGSTSGSFNAILGGNLNRIGDALNAGVIVGTNNTASHNRSVVIGGSNISTTAADTVFVPNLNVSGSIVGLTRISVGTNANATGGNSAVLAGGGTCSGDNAAIIAGTGGSNSQLRSVILGGETNTINGGQGSVIAGGINHTARADGGFIGGGNQNTINLTALRSAIIGGNLNQIAAGHSGSVILGGTSLTTTTSNQVVVPTLLVSGSATFRDNIVVTGSINATSFTGSLNGTASFATSASFANNGVPTGTVSMYITSSAPTGYLLCNGNAVSRTTFASLFNVIGTTYGVGDTTTTFNVPDFRSRMPLGAGSGSGLTPRNLAVSGGAETHTLTVDQIPAHTHNFQQGGFDAVLQDFQTGSPGLRFDNTTTATTSTGGGLSHPIMNPFLTIEFIIKT